MAPLEESQASLPTSLGPYTIRQRIAVGGMSELFLADAPQSAGAARTVAVKRMLPKVAASPVLRQMFIDEATLGMRINHPNVVEVLEAAAVSAQTDQLYLAMEYVPGVDLWRLGRSLTRAGRRLPTDVAVYVARKMLAGLSAVHAASDDDGRPLGVVHRDVSPSNVLLSIHGEVKLSDLGIAQSAAREAGIDAHTKGKLGYLAPEQVRGREPDQRADVFSAAVVTAELLMGRPLFAGGSELAVLLAIRDSKINPFLEFARELESGLGEAVIRALSARPSQRPSSALLFAAELGSHQERGEPLLQAELARYVREAMHGSAALPRMSATPTRASADSFAALNAWSQHDSDTPSPDESSAQPSSLYRVLTSSGEALGPWPLAKMVEALSTGLLGPLEEVRVDDAPPRPLCTIGVLARHLRAASLANRDVQHVQANYPQGSLSLDNGRWVAVLARAGLDRFTGLLLCENGEIQKEVYFLEGAPSFVTSNQASELLGEHLVARGVISRAELDSALAVIPRFEGRLGDTLAGLGLVEPVALFRHIGEQVRDKLLDLFLWQGGKCSRYLNVEPPQSSFPLELDPWEVIREGVERRIERGLEREFLKSARNVQWASAQSPDATRLAQSLPSDLAQGLAELTAQPFEMNADSGSKFAGSLSSPRTLVTLHRLGLLRGTDSSPDLPHNDPDASSAAGTEGGQ